jgi:hypothetical protein
MDLEEIKAKVSEIPSWVWMAGAAVVAIILFMFMKGSGSSNTTTGTGQTSDFTGALGNLSTAIQGLGQSDTASTTTDATTSNSSNPTPTHGLGGNLTPGLPPGGDMPWGGQFYHGRVDWGQPPFKSSGGDTGSTSAPVTPTPVAPTNIGYLVNDPNTMLISTQGGPGAINNRILAKPTQSSYELGAATSIFGYNSTPGAWSPAHTVTQGGQEYYLLDRNFTTTQ